MVEDEPRNDVIDILRRLPRHPRRERQRFRPHAVDAGLLRAVNLHRRRRVGITPAVARPRHCPRRGVACDDVGGISRLERAESRRLLPRARDARARG